MGLLFLSPKKCKLAISALLLLTMAGVVSAGAAAQAPAAQDPSLQRAVGSIKAITDSGITLASDNGDEIKVTLQDSARILRVAPREKDLKNATPIQKLDLQVGDRILVRGKAGADAHSIAAGSVIVMKQADVTSKRQQEKEDWQKHGVGGLVTAVDASSGTITISVMSFAGTKSVVIHTSKDTVLRRYSPNSVKFDDAKVAPLDQIRVGDQLRARGTKNADGSELDAQKVVSGTFRNLAGQVTAIDSAANTLTLKDAISKKMVVVRVTGDAQLRKIPPEFAQRIAMRLKGGMAAGIPGAGAAMGGGERPRGQGGQFPGGGGGGTGGRASGPPDFQQMLNRMPPASLTDLEKGDVVMIVSTEEDGSGTVNAITVLAGVEPILTAAPNASQAMMLSPWTLSSGNAEAAANQ